MIFDALGNKIKNWTTKENFFLSFYDIFLLKSIFSPFQGIKAWPFFNSLGQKLNKKKMGKNVKKIYTLGQS